MFCPSCSRVLIHFHLHFFMHVESEKYNFLEWNQISGLIQCRSLWSRGVSDLLLETFKSRKLSNFYRSWAENFQCHLHVPYSLMHAYRLPFAEAAMTSPKSAACFAYTHTQASHQIDPCNPSCRCQFWNRCGGRYHGAVVAIHCRANEFRSDSK